MVKITCDVCGKARPSAESRIGNSNWVMGYDLQVENSNALQRSMRFLTRWDDTRALELGAIHLCSTKCKEEYIGKARSA